jgi:hypothetical protein
MRVSPATVALLASLLSLLQEAPISLGFHVSSTSKGRIVVSTGSHQQRLRLQQALFATSTEENETKSATVTKKKKKLGLVTFDLGKNRIVMFFFIQLQNFSHHFR